MTVMQKQEQYRPNDRPAPYRRWLATVVANAAISQLRSRNRLPVIGGTDAMLRIHEQVPAPADDMQTETSKRNRNNFLHGFRASAKSKVTRRLGLPFG